ncbi:MAG: heme ABC transporter ATP-binding protein [Chitinophagaceae bacterium]
MVSVEKVSYWVQKNTLLKDVSFTVRPGELVVLLGANGAGKSTLLKMLSGEKEPSMGCVKLDGLFLQDYHPTELARIRATLSQQVHVSMDFSVEEIVMMGRYPHYNGKPSDDDKRIVQETMDICSLDLIANRSILTLSGGEQQRVHLARVLAQIWESPNALLLVDEPTSAMDIQFQQLTLAILKTLAEKGCMVIAAIHDMNLAAQYADRMILLKNGRKFYDGTPEEVLTDRNIYTIFSVDVDITSHPFTLQRQVFTRPYYIKEQAG